MDFSHLSEKGFAALEVVANCLFEEYKLVQGAINHFRFFYLDSRGSKGQKCLINPSGTGQNQAFGDALFDTSQLE